MSMTQEEAIEILEDSKRQNEVMRDNPSTFWASHQMTEGVKNAEKRIASLDIALTALRGPTREMVKRMRADGGWETTLDKGVVDAMGRKVYYLRCPHCGFLWRETSDSRHFRFCPGCGAPMTDEAVDMMVERWKKVLDGE